MRPLNGPERARLARKREELKGWRKMIRDLERNLHTLEGDEYEEVKDQIADLRRQADRLEAMIAEGLGGKKAEELERDREIRRAAKRESRKVIISSPEIVKQTIEAEKAKRRRGRKS